MMVPGDVFYENVGGSIIFNSCNKYLTRFFFVVAQFRCSIALCLLFGRKEKQCRDFGVFKELGTTKSYCERNQCWGA